MRKIQVQLPQLCLLLHPLPHLHQNQSHQDCECRQTWPHFSSSQPPHTKFYYIKLGANVCTAGAVLALTSDLMQIQQHKNIQSWNIKTCWIRCEQRKIMRSHFRMCDILSASIYTWNTPVERKGVATEQTWPLLCKHFTRSPSKTFRFAQFASKFVQSTHQQKIIQCKL